MASGGRGNGIGLQPVSANGMRSLRRYVATWDFRAAREDEITLSRGDIVLVAEGYIDGWMRGVRLNDLEVGFFPKGFVAEDISPIYTLKGISLSNEHYVNDPKFAKYDSCKRSKIALEICTSEQTYYKKLDTLDKRFAGPLSRNGVISTEECNTLFRHIQVLINLSRCVLVHLQSRMEGWDERYTLIGDIFLDLGHHMKVFISYAVHHIVGAQLVLKLNKQEKFKAWLDAVKEDCEWTLNSLLIEPIQRIPRYELLLKDLLKFTAEDHPDLPLLQESLAFVQKIARDCNESIKKAENELKLYTITRSFPNDEVNVIVSRSETTTKDKVRPTSAGIGGSLRISFRRPRRNSKNLESLSFRNFFEAEHKRMFIREGPLLKTTSNFTDPTERYLFLCSDLLLIAQASSRSHHKKRFKLKERVMLRHAWITDTLSLTVGTAIPDNGFILGTPCKIYHFLTSDAAEKTEWFDRLHSHIFNQKRLFQKLLGHLSIPDEEYYCFRTKTRIHYIGILNDELSFRAGEEVSVFGFNEPRRGGGGGGGGGGGRWRAGLYASQQAFDPSKEWYFGSKGSSFGWFPSQCVLGTELKSLEPSIEEVKPAPMSVVLGLKQRMKELTGRQVPPLTDSERRVRVFMGEGNSKIFSIQNQVVVEDIVRRYFRARPERIRQWTLVEQSVDETVQRLLGADEDLSEVVDFWGKSKDQMRFALKQITLNNHHSLTPQLTLVSS